MRLNLFDDKKIENNFISKFIQELRNSLENTRNIMQTKNEKSNVLDEYNIYEKRKIFLDNKSRKGNKLAWVMDENSVCISEDGDGGPVAIKETKLPKDAKVGEVYEETEMGYVYNEEITLQLKEIQ